MASNSAADLFAGTARHYARFRPGYPAWVFDRLDARFGLDGTGRLLDLGCGPGTLALPLANRFEQVVGLDPEPGMLAEAAAAAEAAGVPHAVWIEGAAVDLPTLGPTLGRFRLATMGGAFHWMDRDATLRDLAALIDPGGGVAVVGDGCGIWNGTTPWTQAVTAVVQRWLGEARRAGSGVYVEPTERHETVIARSPFGHPTIERVPIRRTWTIPEILGLLYSTSFCSLPILGDRRDGFERDLTAALLAVDPDGVFVEEAEVELLLASR